MAVLLVAAGAYGLSSLLGSSAPPAAIPAGGQSVSPAPTPASTWSRPVTWLGMEIQTLPPGVAVIETVPPGSQGDVAGLEPGDAIIEINNRPIRGTSDIGTAIQGLRAGDRVTLQISHGSGLYETQVTLAAPPSAYP